MLDSLVDLLPASIDSSFTNKIKVLWVDIVLCENTTLCLYREHLKPWHYRAFLNIWLKYFLNT